MAINELYRGVKPLRINQFNCLSPDVYAPVACYSDFGFRVTEYTAHEARKRLWAAALDTVGVEASDSDIAASPTIAQ